MRRPQLAVKPNIEGILLWTTNIVLTEQSNAVYPSRVVFRQWQFVLGFRIKESLIKKNKSCTYCTVCPQFPVPFSCFSTETPAQQSLQTVWMMRLSSLFCCEDVVQLPHFFYFTDQFIDSTIMCCSENGKVLAQKFVLSAFLILLQSYTRMLLRQCRSVVGAWWSSLVTVYGKWYWFRPCNFP